MNVNDIIDYIDYAPSATKEVFSSITSTNNPTTAKAAKGFCETTVDRLLKNSDLVVKDRVAYLSSVDIDAFIAFATEASIQEKESFRYKLLIAPFKGSWIRLFSYVYDLNAETLIRYDRESNSAYSDVGIGILLAGTAIYLTMENKR